MPSELPIGDSLVGTFKISVTGNGSQSSFDIDHNLGTRDVAVSYYRESGNYDDFLADVTRPTINRVTLTFEDAATATGTWRVLIRRID